MRKRLNNKFHNKTLLTINYFFSKGQKHVPSEPHFATQLALHFAEHEPAIVLVFTGATINLILYSPLTFHSILT